MNVGDQRREVQVASLNQYSAQADDFARTVLNGDKALYGAEDAVLNMRVLEACLKSAEERQRITL